MLPRALRTLANDAVATEAEPHPTVGRNQRRVLVHGIILDGHTISVPFTAVLNGPQQTTTKQP
jgi:hypothetical protein